MQYSPFFMQSTVLLLYPCSTDRIKKVQGNNLGLFLLLLVAREGFEPPTLRVWTACSDQLSYLAIRLLWLSHNAGMYLQKLRHAGKSFFVPFFQWLQVVLHPSPLWHLRGLNAQQTITTWKIAIRELSSVLSSRHPDAEVKNVSSNFSSLSAGLERVWKLIYQ